MEFIASEFIAHLNGSQSVSVIAACEIDKTIIFVNRKNTITTLIEHSICWNRGNAVYKDPDGQSYDPRNVVKVILWCK